MNKTLTIPTLAAVGKAIAVNKGINNLLKKKNLEFKLHVRSTVKN